MPLVERYRDWDIDDQSYDDPHMLAFDHRIATESPDFENVKVEPGLAGVENNVHATCLITTLDASYGWVDAGEGGWIFNPIAPSVPLRPTLAAHFERNLKACIQEDQIQILNALDARPKLSENSVQAGVRKILETVSWPADGSDARGNTSFVSRFPLTDEYIAGPEWFSGYHTGDGIVATAGHCLTKHFSEKSLSTLKVVFGWSGDVRGKRFKASEILSIEKVMLRDSPGGYQDATNAAEIAGWARKWDDAIFKMKGNPEQFQNLGKVELASQPPRFGCSIYNAGYPLGTPLKISRKSHVLRHAIFNGNCSPFSHEIDAQGTYTTDLDQFPGNSGGPVFDGNTGQVIGHTVSTQSAVSESTVEDIENWEKEFLHNSKNYEYTLQTINPYLASEKPNDRSYRIHPKFYRTLSGNPNGGSLFLNATFICPGDIGPHKIQQPLNTYNAVFNRHKWDSLDVIFRNLTGRIDRIYIFTRPLRSLVHEFATLSLSVQFSGGQGKLQRPDPGSNLVIEAGKVELKLSLLDVIGESAPSSAVGTYSLLLDLSAAALRDEIDLGRLDNFPGLAHWTHIRLEQPVQNPPGLVRLEFIIRRAPFPFPVDQNWPPDRPDVTENPKDQDLEWPAEEFRFCTAVGSSARTTQEHNTQPHPPKEVSDDKVFVWIAPIDRVWGDPSHPNFGD